MADYSRTRTNLVNRWGMLQTERSSWMTQWREISNYILPRSGRYFVQDRNKGGNREQNIYDSTATGALRTLGAGLMSGATSPARPWFRLQTPDPSLNAYQPVKEWMDQVTQIILKVFQKSNTYRAFHQMYEELGAFGTACSVIVPDFDTVLHHHPLTAGEYCIGTDAKGNVCTLYRQFQMTVAAMVKEYGKAQCSTSVQGMYEAGNLDSWVTVQHSIEPRADRDVSKRDAKNMPWASYTFEVGGGEDKYLREGGFKRFPAVAPRWSVAGGDIYGNSPGMEALGDIKQLQHLQIRKAQGIDYQTNPPLAVPLALKNQEIDRLPGGITYVDAQSQGQSVRSMFDVNLNFQHLLLNEERIERRIERVFFADLFLMLSNMADPQMTATEVAARQEEKMLMLGPVLERLDNELLTPLINVAFDFLVAGDALPPPPQELQGMELGVEQISVLAQAQRAIRNNATDKLTGMIGAVAQYKPDVLDKFNADAWVDAYSDALGVDPSLIVANDKVAVIRQQRAQAQAAQQQAALQEQQSKTARNLGATPTGAGDNAYDQLNQTSGYTNGGGYLQ